MAVDDSYTKVLLHMNGVDGSTTFTDESGKTWTRYGNAQIDTAQSKFGGASGLFPGSGGYIQTPDSDDFSFGTGDFTIDFQMKRNGFTGQQFLCGNDMDIDAIGNHGVNIGFWTAGSNYLAVRAYGVGDIVSSIAISDTDWHHVALVRYGTDLRLYIGGVSAGYKTSSNAVANSSLKFSVGKDGEEKYNLVFNGWIDEFRVSKGIARWTGNFTPPNVEYGMGGQVIIWTSE